MPAFAKSNVGSLCGTTLLEGTAVWPLLWKNSMKVERTLFAKQEERTLQSLAVVQGVIGVLFPSLSPLI